MKPIEFGALNAKSTLVLDADYAPKLRLLCEKATRHILANVFIVDILQKDEEPVVAGLLESLAAARARGVTVRLIVGGSSDNYAIGTLAEAASIRCKELGVPCKVVASTPGRSSHKKLVVIDDYVLLGSHNWSPGAFLNQTQASLLLLDRGLAAFVSQGLLTEWDELR